MGGEEKEEDGRGRNGKGRKGMKCSVSPPTFD